MRQENYLQAMPVLLGIKLLSASLRRGSLGQHFLRLRTQYHSCLTQGDASTKSCAEADKRISEHGHSLKLCLYPGRDRRCT